MHRQRRPLVVGQRPPLRYFPRDFFFCFLTFKLCIGTFAAVPMETGLATPCFFDFPAMPILLDRGRVATDDPTLHPRRRCALSQCAGRAFRQNAGPARGVRWFDWPCGQNPGRNPEGRQRASSARDDGASANRVHVAGPCSCQSPFPSRVQSEKALDVAIYETCECESLSGGHCKQLRVEHLSAGRSARRRERRTRIFNYAPRVAERIPRRL